IIFIAMVLVAAVAASLLISTAGSLNQQAQETGRLAKQEVSSGFVVIETLGVVDRAHTLIDWDQSDNDGLAFYSNKVGPAGNSTSIVLTTGGSLSVSVSSNTITITYVSGTTTAAQVVSAVNSDSDASALVEAYYEGDGTGTVSATGTYNLHGGSDAISDIFLKLRLNAGSPKIDMDNVVIEVMSENFEASLEYEDDDSDTYMDYADDDSYTIETPALDADYDYAPSNNGAQDASGYFDGGSGASANGGVIRDPEGLFGDASSSSGAHIVSQGTVIMVHINVTAIYSSGLSPQDTLYIKIIPKHGAPTYEEITVPESLVTTFVNF
ncbi:MAG: hypothetical protein J7L88_02540, partial [Thermoplasmata archaeon]|nr:hypothetical protein [Thermoplasmata archaeon]